MLARYLDLDESQRSALKHVLEQRQLELLQMRRTPSSDRTSQIDRFQEIECKTVERIRATLNEEQRKKYDPLGVRNPTPAIQEQTVAEWLKVNAP
jgi:hypothetical protein